MTFVRERNYQAILRRITELQAELAALQGTLAKVNESPYSPKFMEAIADTCSTPATRAGKTQDEVFKQEGT